MRGYRLFISLIFLVGALLNASAYVFIEKEFIQEHDIDNITRALRSENPSDFWDSMLANNQAYQILSESCYKNEKSQKNIQKWRDRWPKFDVTTNPSVLKDRTEECKRLFSLVGLNDSISYCIVNDTSFNSFSGFAPQGSFVALSSGLIDTPGITEEMIIGMIAHESAHIYLNHILQNSLLRKKIEGIDPLLFVPSNSLLVGLFGGAVFGVLEGVSGANAIKLGIPKGKDVTDFNVKYYREIELEADLIAYRFMEWSGIGGDHYIKLLRLIGANDPEGYLGDPNSFYTSHQERIKFINYVKSHPELGNTVNAKLQKKRKKLK